MNLSNMNELHILEEFGLSKNEAKAYLTLLTYGPQNSSDLAYKANIPRAKVYSVINRLIKKDLVVLINKKPMIVDAIPPINAFEELAKHYEILTKNVKYGIDLLEELRIKNRRSIILDKRYNIINTDIVTTINNAISNAKYSLLLTIDRLGENIIYECKDSIERISKNVIIKMLTDSNIRFDGIEAKRTNINYNILIIDDNLLFVIDAINNRCYLFDDKEFVNTHTEIFYNIWNRCLINTV